MKKLEPSGDALFVLSVLVPKLALQIALFMLDNAMVDNTDENGQQCYHPECIAKQRNRRVEHREAKIERVAGQPVWPLADKRGGRLVRVIRSFGLLKLAHRACYQHDGTSQ